MRAVILNILTVQPEGTTLEVFERVAAPKKWKELREGLHLFLQHFILGPKQKFKVPCSPEELIRRVQLAETALTSSETKMML